MIHTLIYFVAKPSIITAPVNTTVIHGNSMILSCQADGHPTPMISWFKSGDRISSTLYSSTRPGFSQLNISTINKADAGDYICVGSNYVGNTSSSIAFVTVYCKFHKKDAKNCKFCK